MLIIFINVVINIQNNLFNSNTKYMNPLIILKCLVLIFESTLLNVIYIPQYAVTYFNDILVLILCIIFIFKTISSEGEFWAVFAFWLFFTPHVDNTKNFGNFAKKPVLMIYYFYMFLQICIMDSIFCIYIHSGARVDFERRSSNKKFSIN